MPKRARDDSDDTEWGRPMTRRRTHWYMKGSERGGGVKMIDRMLRLPVDLYERILGFVHGLEPVSQIMRGHARNRVMRGLPPLSVSGPPLGDTTLQAVGAWTRRGHLTNMVTTHLTLRPSWGYLQ